MRCSRCGNELPNGSMICPNCGIAVQEPNMINNMNVNNNYNNQNNGQFNNVNNGFNQNMNNNQPMMNNNQPMMNNSQPMMNNSQPMMNNNQPMMNNSQPIPNNEFKYNVPQQNNKMIFIILGIVLAIGIIVALILLLTSKNGGDSPNYIDYEKEYREQMEKENKELTSKISTTYTVLKNGDYLFIIQNNSSKAVYVDCPVEFYNDSTVVATETAHISSYILPGSKGFAYIRAYDLDEITFNKVVPKVTAEAYNGKTYDGKISYTDEKKSDYLAVSVTNNSGESLENVYISVLYYDANDNIIGYETGSIYNNLYAGSTNVAKIDYPTDKKYRDLTFSKYEIFVTAEKYE